MTRHDAVRSQAVFGAADGVTVVLGLLLALAGQPSAVLKAAVGAGVAEFVGMTAGAWLSDSRAGFAPAAANGGAALVACLIPAAPYLAFTGALALVSSLALVVVVAAAVAWLRPEHGWRAFGQTFGVLAAAAVLVYAASLL